MKRLEDILRDTTFEEDLEAAARMSVPMDVLWDDEREAAYQDDVERHSRAALRGGGGRFKPRRVHRPGQ